MVCSGRFFWVDIFSHAICMSVSLDHLSYVIRDKSAVFSIVERLGLGLH